MSDVEVERKETLTRQEAADRLAALASALEEGGRVEMPFGDSTIKLRVPDHVRCEVELEVDGDEVELELEMKWSTAHEDPSPATVAAEHVEAEPVAADEPPKRGGRRRSRTAAASTT